MWTPSPLTPSPAVVAAAPSGPQAPRRCAPGPPPPRTSARPPAKKSSGGGGGRGGGGGGCAPPAESPTPRLHHPTEAAPALLPRPAGAHTRGAPATPAPRGLALPPARPTGGHESRPPRAPPNRVAAHPSPSAGPRRARRRSPHSPAPRSPHRI